MIFILIWFPEHTGRRQVKRSSVGSQFKSVDLRVFNLFSKSGLSTTDDDERLVRCGSRALNLNIAEPYRRFGPGRKRHAKFSRSLESGVSKFPISVLLYFFSVSHPLKKRFVRSEH